MMMYFLVALLITVFTVAGGFIGFFLVLEATVEAEISLIGPSIIGALIGSAIGLAFGIAGVVLLRAINNFFQLRK